MAEEAASSGRLGEFLAVSVSGTESSNPACSTDESAANFLSRIETMAARTNKEFEMSQSSIAIS